MDEAVGRAAAQDPPTTTRYLIDLEACPYVSSAGLRKLLKASRLVKAKGAALQVVNVSRTVLGGVPGRHPASDQVARPGCISGRATLTLVDVLATLTVAVLLPGCAGRAANPVMVDQVGENRKSCASIESEMRFTEAELQQLIPETDKTGKNVALGAADAFFLVPLLFQRLSAALQPSQLARHRQGL